jgi:hypothetical protein
MRNKRSFAERVVTDPMEAVQRMVYGAGALEACADTLGVSHQTLSKQLNEVDGNGLALRKAAALEQFLDSDLIAECFAARRGGLFVKLPAIPAGADPHFVAGYARLIDEFAQASHAFSEAVADGKISADEVERFRKELRDVTIAGEQLLRSALARVTVEEART